MSTKIGNYIYNRTAHEQNISIFANTWSDPSLIQTLTIDDTASLIHPNRNTFYNRTIVVEVNFPHPVKIKAALENLPFELMPFTISDTAQTHIRTTITLPANALGMQTLFIKTTYDDNTDAPFGKAVSFQVEPAPTGADTHSLMRLRKYSHNGEIHRWNSLMFAPLPDDYFVYNWITNTILDYLPDAPKDVIIPEKINKTNVIYIANHAFASKAITSVFFPSGISKIGNFAFANNLIEILHIPPQISEIQASAFANNQITALTLSNNITSIGQSAFENNPITTIIIGDDVNIANATSMGLFGASFISTYSLYGNIAGTYIYEDGSWHLIGFQEEPIPVSINISSLPLKTTYQLGEALDITGLLVEALMSDTNTIFADNQDLTITGFDSSQVTPSQTITISYRGLMTSFNVVIETISLVAMTLITPPNQLIYSVGDQSLVLTGLTLELLYSDSSIATLDHNTVPMLMHHGELFIDGFNSSVATQSQNITIEYQGLSVTFNIEIIDSPLFTYEEYPDTIHITGYTGTDMDIVIPATISGKPVTRINANAFNQVPITSVMLPETMTFIGDGAFQDAQLTNIQIPNNVFSIGINAFSGNQLTSLVIPDNVAYIGDEAFKYNKLTTLTLGSGLTSLNYKGAFQYNELTSVLIPNNITSIGMSVFANNNIRNLTLPTDIFMIGEDAFAENQIEDLVLPNSLVMIGTGAFSYNQLTNLSLPTHLTAILSGVFEENPLASVVIPNNITRIHDNAFKNNPLIEITIGNNVMIGTDYPMDVMGIYGQSFNMAYGQTNQGLYRYIDNSWTHIL